MKKHGKHAGADKDEGAKSLTTAKFNVESADAFQVVDQIVALRDALATMEKRPFSAAAHAPAALRRLLEILENINLRVAELESAG
jgi:hypothetical protein